MSAKPVPTKPAYLSEVSELRRRASQNLERAAVTPNYEGDLQLALRLLNEALATELTCYLRYKNNSYIASGLHAKPVADEFEEHALEELSHADMIAKRIRQLGGNPNYNPEGMTGRSHSEYQESSRLTELIQQNLVAERVAIESYREMVRHFENHDPTTRNMLETILAKEEEHADDLANLLASFMHSSESSRGSQTAS